MALVCSWELPGVQTSVRMDRWCLGRSWPTSVPTLQVCPSSHDSPPFTGLMASAVPTRGPSASGGAFSVPFLISDGLWLLSRHPSPGPQRPCPASTVSWGRPRGRPESSFCHLSPLRRRREGGQVTGSVFWEPLPTRPRSAGVAAAAAGWTGEVGAPAGLGCGAARFLFAGGCCLLVSSRSGRETGTDRQRQLPARAGVPGSPESSLQRHKVTLGGKWRGSLHNLFCGFCII